MTTHKQIGQAITSLKKKDGQEFGFKILIGDITDASSYQEKVVYLNTNGTEKGSQVYTWSEVEAEATATDYLEDRRKPFVDGGYPSVRNQLDMIWHDKKDDTTTWVDAIQAVKDANPKA